MAKQDGLGAAAGALGALEYLLPHLAELDRIERASNRGNPTSVPHAQVCINNVRNAVAALRASAL